MKPIEQLMRTAPVIPVLVIEDAADAVPMAQALVTGGLRVLEVTLRTPAALDAIRAMREVEGAIVGAGTVGLNEPGPQWVWEQVPEHCVHVVPPSVVVCTVCGPPSPEGEGCPTWPRPSPPRARKR